MKDSWNEREWRASRESIIGDLTAGPMQSPAYGYAAFTQSSIVGSESLDEASFPTSLFDLAAVELENAIRYSRLHHIFKANIHFNAIITATYFSRHWPTKASAVTYANMWPGDFSFAHNSY